MKKFWLSGYLWTAFLIACAFVPQLASFAVAVAFLGSLGLVALGATARALGRVARGVEIAYQEGKSYSPTQLRADLPPPDDPIAKHRKRLAQIDASALPDDEKTALKNQLHNQLAQELGGQP